MYTITHNLSNRSQKKRSESGAQFCLLKESRKEMKPKEFGQSEAREKKERRKTNSKQHPKIFEHPKSQSLQCKSL